MDADCLSFSPQSSARTASSSPGLEHRAGSGSGSGSFLSCEELQKASHLPPHHRLGLRGDLYAAALGRFGDAAGDFTHGSAPPNPPGSPSKHGKFVVGLSQDRKTATKTVFYENSTEGKLDKPKKANSKMLLFLLVFPF